MHKKGILFLFIYTFLIFLIFTYLLFPSQILKKKIERLISQNFPGQVFIKETSLSLPVCLEMKGLKLTFLEDIKEEKPLAMDIDKIKAGPNFFKILKGKLGIKGEILIGNGIIKANIDQKLIGAPLRYLSSSIENLSIQDFSFIGEQFGLYITGLLKGELTAAWPRDDIIKSDGEWSFNLDKGRIIPKQFPAFDFDSIQGRGIIENENIQIKRIEIQGQDLSLTATGRIRLASELKKFFIDTQVGLKLQPRLRQRLGGFAALLPKPDNKGLINLYISGPPSELRFSSRKIRY